MISPFNWIREDNLLTLQLFAHKIKFSNTIVQLLLVGGMGLGIGVIWKKLVFWGTAFFFIYTSLDFFDTVLGKKF